jgi:hypothetical protein
MIIVQGSPPTNLFINYPLAETVWDVHNHGGLGGFGKYAETLRARFRDDRALKPKPSLADNFIKTIKIKIKSSRLKIPLDKTEALSRWIYKDARRCPSIRLNYELWHKMLHNVTDIPRDQDLADFLNISCLPYSDIMTLDRRMHGYVCQVAKDIDIGYDRKIVKNTEEVLNKLDGEKE